MLALRPLGFFKKSAISIQNAVHQIGLILNATISHDAQHYGKLYGSGQIKALTNGSVKGVAQAPILVPYFPLHLLGGHQATALAL